MAVAGAGRSPVSALFRVRASKRVSSSGRTKEVVRARSSYLLITNQQCLLDRSPLIMSAFVAPCSLVIWPKPNSYILPTANWFKARAAQEINK